MKRLFLFLAVAILATNATAQPKFSQPHGLYDVSSLSVTITGTEGSVIRYTTDGSEPKASSTKYTAPLTLKKTQKMIKSPCTIGREMMFMARFIPKWKLSKKAQKELNRQRRVTWEFSPVTKTVDSRKIYSRKKKAQDRDDYGLSFFYT